MKFTRIVASALLTVLTLGVTASTAFASYYPADRQTYTCVTPDNCSGADHVTFDSFTNNPVVGDERPFLAGSLNGANVEDSLTVKDGDVVTVRAYVHNNADATKMGGEANTVAKNVKFKLLVPTASQTDTNLIGYISADNASPATINDTMSLHGASAFTVEYVKGSAQFAHAADGVNQKTDTLSDDIVNGGASLGDINGCFAYSGYVTLQVKIHMPSTPKPPVTPTYSCDLFHVTMGDNRTVTVDNFKFTASDGSSLSNATIDWGDKSTPRVTNSVVGQTYQYAADGTYTISLSNFKVNDKVVTTTGSCSQTVTTSTQTPPTTPNKLPDTGAGDVIGLVAGAIVVGTVASRLYLARKLSR